MLVALLLAIAASAVPATSEAPTASPSAELPVFEQEDGPLADSALAWDDECSAGSGSGCGLSVLQRHGLKKQSVVLTVEGSPPPAAGAAASPAAGAAPSGAAPSPAPALGDAGVGAAGAAGNASAHSLSGAAGLELGAPAAPASGAQPMAVGWRAIGVWRRLQDRSLDAATSRAALLRAVGGLVVLALGVACICDLAARCRHVARFRQCRRKVQHVHRELLRQDHDLPLCPYCIEFVRGQPSSGKVVFHCGHCFHLACANRFFVDHQERAGLCPICCDSMAKAKAPEAVCAAREGESKGGEPGSSQISSLEESGRSFLLTSLRRMYPETISEACMLRWAACHVEIWLQEIARPKYRSLLCQCRR